jgi:signal peptidase I
MVGLIIFSSILLALMLALSAQILVWIEKLFKIKHPLFLHAVVMILFSVLVGLGTTFVFVVFKTGPEFSLIGVVTSFLALYVLLYAFYKTSFLKSLGIWALWGVAVAILNVLVVIPVRIYVAAPFVVSGSSMTPVISDKDYIIINKFSKNYERGDIIVFHMLNQPDKFLIHRIVGMPGEKIHLRDGQIFINDRLFKNEEGYGILEGNVSTVLRDDEYFVLGDNYTKSWDSRDFGPVQRSNIIGKVPR